ncbi:MAG: hypothetical protein QG635_2373 [Bacteroidota bacterium]|nr:hypothetical protein [Bacteroidota bacterium]
MKTLIIFFTTLIILSAGAEAQLSGALKADFDKANQLYQKGDYEKASALYSQIIGRGYESPEIYFNLGNAYFKLNKIAPSILNFERAKRMAPDDEDIDWNLKVARMKTVDKIEPIPKFFIYAWVDSISDSMSSENWTAASVVITWLFFIFLSGFFFIWNSIGKRIFFGLAGISLLIGILCFVFAGQQYAVENSKDSAIIGQPNVYVKSSPDEKGMDLFILHEGTMVKVIDHVGEWQKIRLADGNVGWLPVKSIEII